MKGSGDQGSVRNSRVLNAVPLQNAVLCAECDVVSDSPHDICMVCGSRSLFNIARVFGGTLPQERINLVAQEVAQTASRELVLPFPKPHRPRRRTTAGPGQITAIALDRSESDEVSCGALVGPKL